MIQRASRWTTALLADASEGVLAGSRTREIAGIATDTRDALRDHLFVALTGDRFDGHDFLAEAIEQGAGALLVSRSGLQRVRAAGFDARDVPLIEVDDTLRALGNIGARYRTRFRLPVIALTGSNGKTTTKEMIVAILSMSRRVLKTEGNLNNLIGVPMTLLGLSSDHQAAVIEMGMNTPGEIARYSEITKPDVGLVVNVGPAHIGRLGSLTAIAEAKGELYRGLDRERGTAVVNIDDPEVARVARESRVQRIRTFGRREGADVRVLRAESTFRGVESSQRLTLAVDGISLEVELPLPGDHNAMNAAAAVAAATAVVDGGALASLDDVITGLPKSLRIKRRLGFESIGSYLLVDDCYNANSASMLAAIETIALRVSKTGERFVALLGEMRELGAHGDREHRKIGEALAAHGASVVGAFGPLAKPIADAALSKGIDAHHEPESVDEMFHWLTAQLRPGDVILVKGSRGIEMERFIERLRSGAIAREGAG